MEDTTPSYERLYLDHQRIVAEWYKEFGSLQSQVQDLRAALASISLFVSAGIGDESTTAEEYAKRIKDGITQMVLDMSKS